MGTFRLALLTSPIRQKVQATLLDRGGEAQKKSLAREEGSKVEGRGLPRTTSTTWKRSGIYVFVGTAYVGGTINTGRGGP